MVKKETTDHLLEYDHGIAVAKGIGILCVIIVHSGIIGNAYNFLIGFASAIFFIITGYLYKKEKWQNRSVICLMKSKVKTLLIPYYIMLFINIFIRFLFEIYKLKSLETAFSNMLIYTVTGSFCYSTRYFMPSYISLWYLMCAFASIFYLYYLNKIKSRWLQYIICILMVTAGCIMKAFKVDYVPWHFDTALFGCAFMYIGQEMRRIKFDHGINLFSILIIFSIGTGAILLNGETDLNTNYIANPILYYIGGISLSYVIMYISKKYIKQNYYLEMLGRGGILILGFNFFFNYLIDEIFSTFILKTYFEYTLWYIKLPIVIVFCSIMCFVYEKIKLKSNLKREHQNEKICKAAQG